MTIDRSELLTFFSQTLGVRLAKLDDRTPLFSSGLVDSFQMIDFIQFIEKKIGRRLRVEEVILENLDTIECIDRFLAQCDEPQLDSAGR